MAATKSSVIRKPERYCVQLPDDEYELIKKSRFAYLLRDVGAQLARKKANKLVNDLNAALADLRAS